MADHEELLEAHKPFLKYDSHETYFADSAAEWTDNPGNRLVTADGTELASAGHGLTLAFLGVHYPDGRPAAKTDRIGDPSRRYIDQARALHTQPQYANRMYGHAVTDGHGDLWLQYWFFYFYNDYNLIGPFIKAGLHEGDWEMVQLHLSGEQPDYAVYAQHAGAESRDWRQVDVLPGTGRPIIYVARGSHASYFEPGLQWTGHGFDHADGKRRSPELALTVVDDASPEFAWVHWPGHWGDTRRGDSPLDSDSPVGPGAHRQWHEPLNLQGAPRAQVRAAAGPEGPPPVPPVPPRVTAEWHDDRVRLRYEVFRATGGQWPNGLVVTINSPEEPEPPTTERVAIHAPNGTVDLSLPVDPTHDYDIFVSAAAPDALASESVRVELAPAG